MRDRQSDPARIRPDHPARYQHALKFAKGPILDAACGMGYGAHALSLDGHEVTAVDIDPHAIEMALTFYNDEHVIRWVIGDLLARPWGDAKFRTIVSFETLEHLEEPAKALRLFRESATDDGMLIASVPNEEAFPFDALKFKGDTYPHKRHYTPTEFDELLAAGGWKVISRGSQTKVSAVINGTHGRFLVYVAEAA